MQSHKNTLRLNPPTRTAVTLNSQPRHYQTLGLGYQSNNTWSLHPIHPQELCPHTPLSSSPFWAYSSKPRAPCTGGCVSLLCTISSLCFTFLHIICYYFPVQGTHVLMCYFFTPLYSPYHLILDVSS
ncbi:uncharacterized protein EI90DRAFT_3048921, partial [Cantharellus anzutake]|uniref:uncharacterized protein n=1 Tax=Cantharellus anzutake TaxID=1750568 RepID=UPI00190582CE